VGWRGGTQSKLRVRRARLAWLAGASTSPLAAMGKVSRVVWPLGCLIVGAVVGSYLTSWFTRYSRDAAAVGDSQLLSSYLTAQYANGTPAARKTALLDYLAMLKRMENAQSDFYPARIIAVDEALTYARLSELAKQGSDSAAAATYLASAEALLEGSVRLGSVAAGAGRECAPAVLIGRFHAAPQLHR